MIYRSKQCCIKALFFRNVYL